MADKIAILLSTYNGEQYLPEQIESIINQSNQSWELFIRDDGSTDQTLTILKQYQSNPRIHWINENTPANRGVIGSFFELLQAVEADYYMFCDQDDVWLPQKVALTLAKMQVIESQNQQQPILVHTDLKVVDQDLEIKSESMVKTQDLDPQATFGRFLVQNSVTGCTVMINQNLKNRCQKINLANIQMHDWWFALVASAFGKIGFVNQATILYRQHGNNQVGAKSSFNELLTRKHLFKKTKSMLEAAMDQAGEFAKQYPSLPVDKVEMIDFFQDVTQVSKPKRYQRLKQYGILKSGFGRNAFYILQILTWS